MGANGNGYGKKLLAQVLFDCNYYNLAKIEVSNLTGDNDWLIRSISVNTDSPLVSNFVVKLRMKPCPRLHKSGNNHNSNRITGKNCCGIVSVIVEICDYI